MLIIFSQTHQNIRNEYLKAHKMNFECASKHVEYDYIKRREWNQYNKYVCGTWNILSISTGVNGKDE